MFGQNIPRGRSRAWAFRGPEVVISDVGRSVEQWLPGRHRLTVGHHLHGRQKHWNKEASWLTHRHRLTVRHQLHGHWNKRTSPLAGRHGLHGFLDSFFRKPHLIFIVHFIIKHQWSYVLHIRNNFLIQAIVVYCVASQPTKSVG